MVRTWVDFQWNRHTLFGCIYMGCAKDLWYRDPGREIWYSSNCAGVESRWVVAMDAIWSRTPFQNRGKWKTGLPHMDGAIHSSTSTKGEEQRQGLWRRAGVLYHLVLSWVLNYPVWMCRSITSHSYSSSSISRSHSHMQLHILRLVIQKVRQRLKTLQWSSC